MRRFIVCTPSLDELSPWRFARIVTSSFYLSHDIRRDVVLGIVVGDTAIRMVGSRLRHIHVDEQSLSGIYRKIASALRRGHKGRVHWGVYITEPRRLLSNPGYSVATGRGCRAPLSLKPPYTYYFGCGKGRETICLSPRRKTTDAAIAILNIALDRVEEGEPPII